MRYFTEAMTHVKERNAIEIEGQIKRRSGMGQRADADPIDAGLGQGSDRKKTYTTGGLELNPGSGGITPSDGLSDLLGPEVVNQDDIGRAIERTIELFEGIDFDLDGCARGSGSSRRGYRSCERIRAGSVPADSLIQSR